MTIGRPQRETCTSGELNAPGVQLKVVPTIALETVELYPYVEYMKYLLAGSVSLSLTLIGSLMAGLGVIFHPESALLLLLLIVCTSVAFNGFMFLLMVRVEDPLVPRAMFGVLNTLLFFPSGAISPVTGFHRG